MNKPTAARMRRPTLPCPVEATGPRTSLDLSQGPKSRLDRAIDSLAMSMDVPGFLPVATLIGIAFAVMVFGAPILFALTKPNVG